MQIAHQLSDAINILLGLSILGAIAYAFYTNRREEVEGGPEEDSATSRQRRLHFLKAANLALDSIIVRVADAQNHNHSLRAEAWRAVTGELTTSKVGIAWLNHVLEHRRAHDKIDKEVYDAILFGIHMAWGGYPAPSIAKAG